MTAGPPPTARRRSSLALRISVLTAAVAIIAALIAGLLASGLIRRSDESAARSSLASLADAIQAEANTGIANTGVIPERAALRALHVQFAIVNANARITGGTPLGRATAAGLDLTTLVAGQPISTTKHVNGVSVLIEGRPVRSGAVVLVQLRSDALATGDEAIRRLVIALAIGVGVAIALGLLVAWRLGRPLRRTADGAHALAAGHRNVVVQPEGPAEVAAVAEALNTLSGALSHSESRQRDFLMSVSHDLRTPLTAITGYSESLADGVIEPDQLREVGLIMSGEAQRLQRLVTDLLDLARMDAQDFRLDLGLVDLVDLARAAAPVWRARCTAAGVIFTAELGPDPVFVHTDAARMRQVLDGLFDNALRMTPEGRPVVLAVRVDSGPDGRGIAAVEVRDGGPGLSDTDLAVAFERGELFRRYQGVRQVGTGLGLAIVHRLVGRLGGTIDAGHAPEGGARFTVRLPSDAGTTS